MDEGKKARLQVAKILDVASKHTGSIATEISANAAQALVSVDLVIAQRDELLAALIELRDFYKECTGLPAVRANSAIADASA